MKRIALRQIAGSLPLAIPPEVKKPLDLMAGTVIEVSAERGSLVARPLRRKCSIDELIAKCDLTAPYPNEAREWLDAPAAGREQV